MPSRSPVQGFSIAAIAASSGAGSVGVCPTSAGLAPSATAGDAGVVEGCEAAAGGGAAVACFSSDLPHAAQVRAVVVTATAASRRRRSPIAVSLLKDLPFSPLELVSNPTLNFRSCSRALPPLGDRQRLPAVVLNRKREQVALHLPVPRPAERERTRLGLTRDDVGQRVVLHVDGCPAVGHEPALLEIDAGISQQVSRRLVGADVNFEIPEFVVDEGSGSLQLDGRFSWRVDLVRLERPAS